MSVCTFVHICMCVRTFMKEVKGKHTGTAHGDYYHIHVNSTFEAPATTNLSILDTPGAFLAPKSTNVSNALIPACACTCVCVCVCVCVWCMHVCVCVCVCGACVRMRVCV